MKFPSGGLQSSRRALSMALLLGLNFFGSSALAQNNPVPRVNLTPAPVVPIALSRLPMLFEVNEGQTDRSVKFLTRGARYALFLTSSEAVLSFSSNSGVEAHSKSLHPVAAKHETRNKAVVRLQLIGANPESTPVGLQESSAKSNYFVGRDPSKWHTNVPSFERVKFSDVYRGIDLIYYGKDRQLEHDFVVSPGATPNQIRFRLVGAKKVALDQDGNLVLDTQAGRVCLKKPFIYQEKDGVRKTVAGGYSLRGRSEVTFHVGSYDSSKSLIIDPVLNFSTYFGGSGGDAAFGVALDQMGDIYLVGATGSIDFPLKNPIQSAFNPTICGNGLINFPCGDAFISKFNPTATQLIYSTYLGGSGNENGARGLKVDGNGNAYVVGTTSSPDFPTTPGAFSTTFVAGQCGQGGGPLFQCREVFVAELNPAGSQLVFSTFLGGVNDTVAAGIALDSLGNTYVTGTTFSLDFPTTPGAFQTSCKINPNAPVNHQCAMAFVSKLNSSGTALIFSTYLGGTGGDGGNAVEVDPAGSAYVAGGTNSSDFPLVNPFQSTPSFVFVTKLTPDGSALTYSTFLGGTSDVLASGITLDSSENAYVVGEIVGSNFPTTPGAFQTSGADNNFHGFVSKINPAGSSLLYSTFLDGSVGSPFGSSANAVKVDEFGRAYVVGATYRTDFPEVNPVQNGFGGGVCGPAGGTYSCPDAFVSVFNPAGSALVFSTYLGGSGNDQGTALALDNNLNIYVVGFTSSSNFPIANAFQSTYTGGSCPNGPCTESFLAKIQPLTPSISPISLTFASQEVGSTSPPQSVTVTNPGTSPVQITGITITGDFAQTSACGSSISGNGTCVINVTFTPTSAGQGSGNLTASVDAAGEPLSSVSLTGSGSASSVSLSPTSLSFAGQLLTTTSTAQALTLTNSGNVALTISSVTLTGSDASDFTISTNTCGASLAANASCSISVAFRPSASGTRLATLNINDNAPGSPQTVSLNGTGTDLQLGAGNNGSTMATLTSGQTATYNLQLQSLNGFTGATTLAVNCSNVPAVTNCSVAPSSVALSGNVPSPFTVSVGTTPYKAAGAPSRIPIFLPPAQSVRILSLIASVFIFLGLLAYLQKPNRGIRQRLLPALAITALFAFLFVLAGCGGGSGGGGGGPQGTPPGTYTVVVTATSQGVSRTLDATLIVK